MDENEAMKSNWQKAIFSLLQSKKELEHRAVFTSQATLIVLIGSIALTSLSLVSPSSKYQIEILQLASANGAKFDPINAIETLAVKGRAHQRLDIQDLPLDLPGQMWIEMAVILETTSLREIYLKSPLGQKQKIVLWKVECF